MKLTIKLRKKELEDDYQLFMRETAEEARMIDRHDAASYFEESKSDSDMDIIAKPSSSKSARGKKSRGQKGKGTTQTQSTPLTNAETKMSRTQKLLKSAGDLIAVTRSVTNSTL